ncbi:MAG: hypothetical protein HOM11_10240 [Methylococcales bacterium]|nr:hypothetical protein [Methylococcales bacterium]MBT7445409.1 hypothetical protein [Methylococcales bacterium]
MSSEFEDTILAYQSGHEPVDSTEISASTTTAEAPEYTYHQSNVRFENKGLLGMGGLCEVSRIYDKALHRQIALKHLKTEFQNHTEALLRFQY